MVKIVNIYHIFIPAKAREYVFTGVDLCVCLSVCLSMTTITKKIVDGFVPNFMGRFIGGKGRPISCFVIQSVDGCGSNGQKKLRQPAIVYISHLYAESYLRRVTHSNLTVKKSAIAFAGICTLRVLFI